MVLVACGFICFTCHKVLGIYTYTRKVTLDEFENKPRKTMVWFEKKCYALCDSATTVSRVTALYHISMWCILSAIRLLSSKNQDMCLLFCVLSVIEQLHFALLFL